MYQIAICDDEKIFTDKLAHTIIVLQFSEMMVFTLKKLLISPVVSMTNYQMQ